jgi:hypothetical protein
MVLMLAVLSFAFPNEMKLSCKGTVCYQKSLKIRTRLPVVESFRILQKWKISFFALLIAKTIKSGSDGLSIEKLHTITDSVGLTDGCPID